MMLYFYKWENIIAMQTKILKPTKDTVALACKLLKVGEIVAIPTETV